MDYACKGQSTKIAKIMLERGWDVSHITPGTKNCLHFAAESGSNEQIELLLDKGVPVDSEVTLDHSTPLIFAVKKQHTSTVKLLLDNNANVNHQGYVSATHSFL